MLFIFLQPVGHFSSAQRLLRKTLSGVPSLLTLILSVLVAIVCIPSPAGAVDVTQYHYDVQRTGWNSQETVLNVATVSSSNFGLIRSVALPADEQIDAQPLVISAATFASRGITTIGGIRIGNDVVYVATEMNNVYAIDSMTGRILLSKNFGAPVSIANLPGRCDNNYNTVGITSTPVIDTSGPTMAMFLVTYTWEGGNPIYRIRKIDVTTFADITPARVIAATGQLSDGSTTTFQAGSQRQRPALLLANGNVYAAFGSFCDFNSQLSRGWLLGWNSATLVPLTNVGLTDNQTGVEAGTGLWSGWSTVYYLSSIWMSGFGPAADAASSGNVYFLTGNSDGKAAHNLPENAVKASSDLSRVVAHYIRPDYASLDATDNDFGSGGIMVVPGLSGAPATRAVGAGKDGRMYLFNLADMTAPSYVNIGGCWCGPSYFVGSDSIARVVSSGGTQVKTWLLPGSTGISSLDGASSALQAGQDPGFMSSVSSNNTSPNSAIIWAVSRPNSLGNLKLYAFNGVRDSGGNLAQLKSFPAGRWASPNNNANVVPVVANGSVFVASHGALNIYGNTTTAPPAISSVMTVGGFVNSSFSYTITATGSPTSFGASPLPSGLSLSGSTISGIPSAKGTFNILLSASNAYGTGYATLVVNISPQALLGATTIQPIVDSNAVGWAEAFQATAAASGPVGVLSVYLDPSSIVGGAKLMAGLYADAGGHPGALLSKGTNSALTAGAWNAVSIPPYTVNSGTRYWIAILSPNSSALYFRDGSGCSSENSLQTNLTDLPSAWSSGPSYPSCPLSGYGRTAGP